MAEKRPIPVRFGACALARLDVAAHRMGLDRSALIRLLVQRWLDYFGSKGEAAMPLDWRTILAGLDGRTKVSKAAEAPPDYQARTKRKPRK